MDIDRYCDLAIKRNKIRSDRDLAAALGFTGPSVSNWRTKRAWPSDETMLKLADLAGIEPEQALLDLNLWRSFDTPAFAVYERLAKKIAGTAAAALLAGILIGQPQGLEAATHSAPARPGDRVTTIDYGKYEIDPKTTFPGFLAEPLRGCGKSASPSLRALALVAALMSCLGSAPHLDL